MLNYNTFENRLLLTKFEEKTSTHLPTNHSKLQSETNDNYLYCGGSCIMQHPQYNYESDWLSIQFTLLQIGHLKETGAMHSVKKKEVLL